MKQTHVRIYPEDLAKLNELRERLGCDSSPKAISSLLKDTSLIHIFDTDYQQLIRIMRERGFQNLSNVVHDLLANLEEDHREIATLEKVMNLSVPVVLCGKPMSGKTTWIKEMLLPSLYGKSPVLVIDPLDEYLNLKKVGFDIFSFDFENCLDQLRFVPEKQSQVAETMVGTLFANLEMKHGSLLNWVFVIEESQSYRFVPSFVKFLFESRHHCRKMVCVTSMLDAYRGLETLTVIPR
jgi:hypothetical protein